MKHLFIRHISVVPYHVPGPVLSMNKSPCSLEASLLMEKDGLNIIKLESSHQILDSNKHVGESLETTAS